MRQLLSGPGLTTVLARRESTGSREFYRELLRLRQELISLTDLGRQDREVEAYERQKVLWVRMNGELAQAVIVAYFGQEPQDLSLLWPEGGWHKRLDSAAARSGRPRQSDAAGNSGG